MPSRYEGAPILCPHCPDGEVPALYSEWVLRRDHDAVKTERDTLRLQLRDAEAQRDPLVVDEEPGSYLVGRKVASAAMYNTVLSRAMKAEAERDGRREMLRTAAEKALDQIRALHQPYRSVYDEGDNRSCAHCNQLTGYAVPYPCDTVKALDSAGSEGVAQ